jgi:hypothetical protein
MTPERRVLIIDASALIRKVAEMILGLRGWTTLTAAGLLRWSS